MLVVEDEPALAAAVSEALTDAGFVVDRAGDGEEALRRVGAKSYDLIVCDLKMPKIDGIRFYQKLAASYPDVARRVIFVTGDVAGTEAEKIPAGQRLPLAREAVQARRSAPHRARNSRVKNEKPGDIRAGPPLFDEPNCRRRLSRRRDSDSRMGGERAPPQTSSEGSA